MKTLIAGTLLATLVAFPAVASNHDRPAQGDISMDEARRIAEREGYPDIVGIEYDDGQWEIEARDPSNGREVDIEINAATGEVVWIDRGLTFRRLVRHSYFLHAERASWLCGFPSVEGCSAER
jgi:hypothetical protein